MSWARPEMNAQRLLQHFDRIAEAPDAVGRLRRFILDLAVRGKLVEQDPRDEAALNRLKKRSARVESDDEPFDIPGSWTWARVADVAECRLGKMLDKAKNKGTPRRYLRNINVRWFDFDLSNVMEMRFEDSELTEFGLRHGDVLICEGGEPGRAAVWDEREADIYFQKAIHRIRFSNRVDPHFFVIVLRVSADSGDLATYFTGVGIKHFTGKGLSVFQFPLPPLAEQRRIVAKVGELMALCDRLENAQAERESRRDRVAAASLNRLNNGADAESFREHARFHLRFHLRHLTRLTTRLEHIQFLRQTVLNLAVRGRLGSQDPNDEPAEAMLRRIHQARARLYAEKKIPKPKDLPRIEDFGIPFAIPVRWNWTMLGMLCYQVSDGPHFSPSYVSRDEGVPFLSTRNVRLGGFDLTDLKYVSRKDHEEFCKRIIPDKGDILYTKGGTTGIARVNDLDFEFSVWVHLAVLRVAKEFLEPRYIELALNSPLCYEQSQAYTQGISNFDLGLTRMIKIVIPLPPLAEQHRIVAKVDQLMALCDQLEAQLTTTQSDSRRLLEAVVRDALAPVLAEAA